MEAIEIHCFPYQLLPTQAKLFSFNSKYNIGITRMYMKTINNVFIPFNIVTVKLYDKF